MSVYGKAIEESCKQNEEVVNESIVGLAVVGLVKLLAGVAAFIAFNVALATILVISSEKAIKDQKAAYEKIKSNRKLMNYLQKGYKNIQAFIKANIKESKYFEETPFKFEQSSVISRSSKKDTSLKLKLHLFDIDTVKIFEDIMKVKFKDYVKDRLIKEKYFEELENGAENEFDLDDYFNENPDDYRMGFDEDTKPVKEYLNNMMDRIKSLTKSNKNNLGIPISFEVYTWWDEDKFTAIDDIYTGSAIFVTFTIKDYNNIDPNLKEIFKKNGIDIEKEIEEAKNGK